jgi:prepilin-type N-terminal cleavage/methylation domain-containing protein
MIAHLSSDQRGFTIAELLVSMVVALLIVGGAVTITSQVQTSYRRQMEETAAEQEGRYALDWVSRLIRAAGNNPYMIKGPLAPLPHGDCPLADTPFNGLIVDPNGDGVHIDVRIQTDSNPPDKLLGGSTGACNQPNEDVTVRYDAGTRTIQFLDNNLGLPAEIRTEPVITALQFIYRDGSHALIDPITTAMSSQVMYVETRITVVPRAIGNQSGNITRTMSQEVRIKGRNF